MVSVVLSLRKIMPEYLSVHLETNVVLFHTSVFILSLLLHNFF